MICNDTTAETGRECAPGRGLSAPQESWFAKENPAMSVNPKRRAKLQLDAWSQTLALLSSLSLRDDATPADPPRLAGRRLPLTPEPCAGAEAKVRILDRPSKNTAIVSWFDPTVCRYGDQPWRASRARHPGTCAMTGRSIRRGDPVYRPRTVRPCPLNANAMILASCVEYANAESMLLTAARNALQAGG